MFVRNDVANRVSLLKGRNHLVLQWIESTLTKNSADLRNRKLTDFYLLSHILQSSSKNETQFIPLYEYFCLSLHPT